MGAIVRTAGVGRTPEELQWDLNNLKAAWDAIVAANDGRPAPFLIFQESDAVTRGLRDYFSDDVGECLIDQPEAFQKAQEYMQRFMPPDAQRKLKLYQDPVPLFTRYQIESQIESAYSHKVTLPSGGSLVIDHTEALVSIDINSARSTRGGDIEATARNTNLEAAEEIARQLRLRDIGGLIVIDFIDMESTANQRAVEDMLRDAVKMDRARIQLGRLSRFGLLELSRQRLRPALSETTHISCPRCSGMGTIRGVESMSLALLRLIGEEARKERTGRVIAQVPVDVATYLMNEKRDWLIQIEQRDKVSLVIVPNPNLQTPAYTLRRLRDDEKELPENTTVSYQLADQPSIDDSNIGSRDKKPQSEAPLVPSILPASAAPVIPIPVPEAPVAPLAAAPIAPTAVAQEGALVRLWKWLFGTKSNTPATVASESTSSAAAPVRNGSGRDGAAREGGAYRDSNRDRYRNGGDRNRDRNRDSRRDASGRDGSGRDGSGRDGQGRDGGGRDGSGRDGSARDGQARDSSRDPRRDRQPPRDGSGRDGSARDASGRDGAGRDNPRGENRPESGSRRPETGPQGDRQGSVPRSENPRSEGQMRADAPRGDAPRSDQPPRADQPRDANGEVRPAGERGERGRSRRRRGRGRRDGGGDNPANANGQGTAGEGDEPLSNTGRPDFAPRSEADPRFDAAPSADAAPRLDPAPRPDSAPRTDAGSGGAPIPLTPAATAPAATAPVPVPPVTSPGRSPDAAPPPRRDPVVAAQTDASAPSGNDGKYVVWSSTPTEAPPSTPEDR